MEVYNRIIKSRSEVIVMKQKSITIWLKAVTAAVALLGLAFFGGGTLYAFCFKPDYNEPVPVYLRQNIVAWWITAVICYLILFFFGKIVKEIGDSNSFSLENVKNFKCMGICGALAIIEYAVQILVWLIKGRIELIPLSYAFLKIIVFVLFVILCYAMSKLVQNAYEIKQENELTI